MGRAMTAAGEREEAQCELVAIGHELMRGDLWEMAALDVAAALEGQLAAQLEAGDIGSAHRTVAELRALTARMRRHDLAENARHRAMVTAARGMGAELRRVS